MSETLDKRLHAYRDDLADASLEGQVSAAKFVTPKLYQIRSAIAPLKRAPRFDAPLDTQALFGQIAKVFEMNEGWAWGQLGRDRYVGYLPTDSLSDYSGPSTHIVSALSTFAYSTPDIKTPPLTTLYLNSELHIVDEVDKFVKTTDDWFIYAAHVCPIETADDLGDAEDFVSVAERFVETPYLWGGCSAHGIDCSALVQQSLLAAGFVVLRDSDMQEQQLGDYLPDLSDLSQLKRGDLVFWKGHVGIMIDPDHIVHSNGYHMKTHIEPVREAIKRIADMYGEVTSFKRQKHTKHV